MNPWIIVAVLLALAVAAFGGYRHGRDTAINEMEAAKKAAIEEAIKDANINAENDLRAAAKAEAGIWNRRLRDAEARHKLALDIERRKPSPECRAVCDLDDTSLGILQERVRGINASNTTVSPPGSGDTVPAASPADKRDVGGGAAVPR